MVSKFQKYDTRRTSQSSGMRAQPTQPITTKSSRALCSKQLVCLSVHLNRNLTLRLQLFQEGRGKQISKVRHKNALEVCARACMRECTRACVRGCVCVSVNVYMLVRMYVCTIIHGTPTFDTCQHTFNTRSTHVRHTFNTRSAHV